MRVVGGPGDPQLCRSGYRPSHIPSLPRSVSSLCGSASLWRGSGSGFFTLIWIRLFTLIRIRLFTLIRIRPLTLMRIRIQPFICLLIFMRIRIRLFTLMRIWIRKTVLVIVRDYESESGVNSFPYLTWFLFYKPVYRTWNWFGSVRVPYPRYSYRLLDTVFPLERKFCPCII